MKHVTTKIVAKLLNLEQKQGGMFNDEPESWLYGYNIETKAQSFQ